MTVKLYSAPKCTPCEKAKKYLEIKGVPYKEVDITDEEKCKEDENCREIVKAASNKSGVVSVPILTNEGRAVLGFDKEKIDDLIRH